MIRRIWRAYAKWKNPIKFYRKQGMKIGSNCRFVGNNDFGSEPYLISIGNHVSITSSNFVTHDGGIWVFRDNEPLLDVIAPIMVGNNVFIGLGCIILPGTYIGDNVVIGAGSVVKGNVASNSVYAGIPAKPIKSIEEYYKSLNSDCKFHIKAMSRDEKKRYLIKHILK